MVEELIRILASEGVRRHSFGFQLQGLARTGRLLQSADSLAWSFAAQKCPPLPG